ncbi:hypothetical protein Tco_0540817 [Tanacetum coccineum]
MFAQRFIVRHQVDPIILLKWFNDTIEIDPDLKSSKEKLDEGLSQAKLAQKIVGMEGDFQRRKTALEQYVKTCTSVTAVKSTDVDHDLKVCGLLTFDV